MEVKQKIKQLLKERGWTLSKLAKEANISQTSVYNWYNNKNFTPSRDAIEDVCAAFGITLSQFFADVDVDKLTEKELELLELFRQVPDKKQEAVIAVVKTFVEQSE